MNPIGNIGGFGAMANVPLWLIALVLWSIVWKGFALWRAAKRDEKWWFVIFLFLNTAGILEIIYLFVIAKTPASLKQEQVESGKEDGKK